MVIILVYSPTCKSGSFRIFFHGKNNKSKNATKEADANFVEIKKDNLMVNSNEQTFTPSIVLTFNGCALQIADGFNQVTLKNILAVVKEL